jgi:hypothetical protein
MADVGTYIYCITDAKIIHPITNPGMWDESPQVTTIQFEDLCAIVSKSPIDPYREERKHLLHHQMVNEEVMGFGTMIPFSFNTIATNDGSVLKMLAERCEDFRKSLNHVRGRVELGVKVVWKKDVVFKDILAEYNDIRLERDTLLRENIHDARRLSVIGEKIGKALQEKNEREKSSIMKRLSKLACETSDGNILIDQMIMNASFLVSEENEGLFDAAIADLDKEMGEKITIKYVGPCPPASIVSIAIHSGELKSVVACDIKATDTLDEAREKYRKFLGTAT